MCWHIGVMVLSCITQVDWENRKVAGMGWTDHEQLVVVLIDGMSFDVQRSSIHVLFYRKCFDV